STPATGAATMVAPPPRLSVTGPASLYEIPAAIAAALVVLQSTAPATSGPHSSTASAGDVTPNATMLAMATMTTAAPWPAHPDHEIRSARSSDAYGKRPRDRDSRDFDMVHTHARTHTHRRAPTHTDTHAHNTRSTRTQHARGDTFARAIRPP